MFEAYKVGITVALVNHVSSGMGHIITSLTGGGKAAKALNHELGKIKLLATGTSMVAGAGFMGLGVIGKTIKPASEYVHQLVMMNNEGMKHVDILKATQAAWDGTKIVPTSSVAENLASIRELKMVTGNVQHAIEYMPTLQKIQGILGTVRHDQASAKNESYELAKSLEMKGSVFTPQQFVGAADLMTKAIVAAGGKVGASDFLSAFKYGRAATSAWNDDFTYKILPTLIQEMKGGGSGGATGGPGSALMSMYSAVVGGTVTQRALAEWQKLGLLDPSKVVWTKDGHAKGVRPGGIMGSDQFQANPYDWVQKTLMPALSKAGITTETGVRQTLQYLFPNRTAGFIATQFALQSWKFERDRKLIDQAKGLGGYDALVKTDPMMAKMALAKQWESLLAVLGYQIMPALIAGARVAIDATRTLSGWFQRHSTTTKVLVWGFITLSSAMAIGGTLATLRLGFKGLGLVLPLLTATGSGIPALIGVLGKGGLVAAAGVAGLAIGGLINKLIGNRGQLGEWLYDKFYKAGHSDPPGWDGDKWVGLPSRSAIDPVKPATKSGPIRVSTQINLDGRKVAEVVTTHQSNEANRPQNGMNGRFDSILTLAPVGY